MRSIYEFLLRCLLIVVIPLLLSAQENPKSASDSSKQNDLYHFLDELFNKAASEGFSGAFLVSQDGKLIYQNASGLANQNFDVKNTVNTKFNTASLSKMFTGVAIAKLAEEGKLSFDDKVGKYLPDYPNEKIKNEVSIHHLLTHTSGIGSWWDEFFDDKNWAELKTTQDFDNLINTKPLESEPGAQFKYSNGGPLILGLIIEKISSKSFEEFVQENIFNPAGMNNTGYYDVSKPVKDVALGYTMLNSKKNEMYNELTSNLFIHPTKGGPAGGAYTTVYDLHKFDIALQNNILLTKESFDILTTGKVDSDIKGVRYAYLFQDIPIKDRRVIGHSGGSAGISAAMDIHIDTGYTVIILSNMDKGNRMLLGPVFSRLLKE